jgi:hypothetical protein
MIILSVIQAFAATDGEEYSEYGIGRVYTRIHTLN